MARYARRPHALRLPTARGQRTRHQIEIERLLRAELIRAEAYRAHVQQRGAASTEVQPAIGHVADFGTRPRSAYSAQQPPNGTPSPAKTCTSDAVHLCNRRHRETVHREQRGVKRIDNFTEEAPTRGICSRIVARYRHCPKKAGPLPRKITARTLSDCFRFRSK